MKLTFALCGMLCAACVLAAPQAATTSLEISIDTDSVATGKSDTLRIEKRIVVRMRGEEGGPLVVEVDSTVGEGVQIDLDLEGLDGLEGLEGMLEALEMGIEEDGWEEDGWEEESEAVCGLWKGISLGTGMFFTGTEAVVAGLPEVDEWGTPANWSFADDRIGSNWRIELNPIEYRAKLIGDRFGMTTGVGLDMWRVGVEDGVKLRFADAAADTGLEAVPVDSLNMRRHAVRAGWVRIPVLFDLRTSREAGEGFHLAAGIVGGIKLYSSYLRVYEDAVGGDWKEKYKGFGVNRFAASGRIQAGFKHVSLVLEVPMLPFFEGELENNVGAVTVGLHFGSHE